MPEPLTVVGVTTGLIGLGAHLARRYFDLAKEILDIVMAFICLVLALPVLGICALMIRLSSKGPVFYTQVRLGRYGRPFRMYKLRTMYCDAESQSGAVWAGENDPRIVPVCRWMRRSHVDELPQLVNVIRGDMSLVGPRPERPEIMNELEKVYPNIRKRLAVRPGITGLAQIENGYDTAIEGVRNKIKLDLEYIEQRRWATELRILAATVTRFNDRMAR